MLDGHWYLFGSCTKYWKETLSIFMRRVNKLAWYNLKDTYEITMESSTEISLRIICLQLDESPSRRRKRTAVSWSYIRPFIIFCLEIYSVSAIHIMNISFTNFLVCFNLKYNYYFATFKLKNDNKFVADRCNFNLVSILWYCSIFSGWYFMKLEDCCYVFNISSLCRYF